MNDSTIKCCSQCGEAKPLTEFVKSGAGHKSYCKECHRRAAKERRAADPAHSRRLKREWYQRNREAILEARRVHYAKHGEHERAAQREAYRRDPTRKREASRKQSPRSKLSTVLRQHLFGAPSGENLKLLCRRAVYYAVKAGVLTKPVACERCGAPATSNPKSIHAHHRDYGFALLVEWLCPNCHAQHHPRVVSGDAS